VKGEAIVVRRLKRSPDSLLTLKKGSVNSDMVVSFRVQLGEFHILRVDVLAR
jgi:hypothetical protein